jgi:hypothetical protein
VGAAIVCALLPSAAAAQNLDDTYARIEPTQIVLGNSLVERRWSREQLRTTALIDKRDGGVTWSRNTREFAFRVGPAEIGSDSFRVESATVTQLPRGGLRVRMAITGPALTGIRVAEVYPGTAGFRTQTTLTSPAPLTLNEAVLEEATVGPTTKPTLHALRSGADWRDSSWAGPTPSEEYPGPPTALGDPHAGDWRDTRTAAAGTPLEAAAQWFDGERANNRRLFMVMERNDFPSSWVEYDGATARLRLQYARDVISLGPFEEQFHVENPNPEGGRARTLRPGEPFTFEATFTGVGSGSGDAEWQWSKYLHGRRLDPHYPHAITFNSDKNDRNQISTGAKDDTNIAAVRELAPIAKRLGVETFVLDDGWQARSGDWCPDSPNCPEPRAATDPKYGPRFPDPTFTAVREAVGPMRLGLWMSPLHFNPSSTAYRAHPEWVCSPAGHALVLYNLAQPYEGSNEAGLGQWSNAAFPFVEARIREAIVKWGVRFFKFDFMAWLDCAGSNDLYEQHDEFVRMLDRIHRDHPDVTLQIDETNDYRLFPFESVPRGPSWFQNGTPETKQLVHNLWLLNPYVPGFSIGQHVLGGDSYKKESVDTIMAAALPSYITFWSDLRTMPDAVVQRAATWLAFYKRFRGELSQHTYPLLDDPLNGGWTALQAWDPEEAHGALYAFRQGADEDTKRIALRNVPPGLRFDVFEGPTGDRVDRVSSADLTRGIDVKLGAKGAARVLVFRLAPGEAPPGVPAPQSPGPSGASGPFGPPAESGSVSTSNPLGLPGNRECVDRRRFSFKLHRPKHTRIVRVEAFVNGKRKLRVKGKDVRRVSIAALPKKRFVVRIHAFHSNGTEVISTRVYKGCKKSKPTTTRRPGK